MKSKQKIKRKRVKARHQKPSHFGGDFKPFPAWGKLVAILGMTLASGLFLLVAVSAYFADYTGVTLGFNIPTYYFTVDYNSNGGSAVVSEDVKVGESITEPTPPTKTGYNFTSWHQQADLADTAWHFTNNKMPKQNLTLYAKWTAKQYAITYAPGTKGDFTSDNHTADYDSTTPAFAGLTDSNGKPKGQTGYEFDGWSTAVLPKVNGDKTYTAQWKSINYTITYAPGAQGDFTSDVHTAAFDSTTPAFAGALESGKPKGKTGYTFNGWNPTVLTTVDGDKTYTAQWQANQYDITYELDGGDNVSTNPAKYTYGVGVTSFADASKAGFTFKGWYSAASGGIKIESISTTTIGNQILYAQWESPAIKVTNTDPGSEFDFAGSKWRILDTDMDNNASNGLQALVIRVDPIGTGSLFLASGTYYFETSGIINGYERSRSIGGVGQVIDDWYKDNIAGTAVEAYVQAVALNNPTFTTFKSGTSISSSSTVTNWSWSTWYQDTRFATTLDSSGSKHAFALSYGDIHGHMGVPTTETITSLLDFTSNSIFWLRSAGHYYHFVSSVAVGNISSHEYYVSTTLLPVRPSLSLLIEKI